ncbi:energy coupling factor transporter S component ThiW [Metabacillus arenae]|uniref:Energy coupling factor transporter S component ThiW n=1 Tax=Metabacillus arenae TaxID=2771434 RepID=A0A926RW97_9BACI|nr:energy coupling factor transporter S component ThiW [Metabacillus arenae]MBD1380553.1 energy coupling factor transporter S component ThiW [Metabacillus arenae]
MNRTYKLTFMALFAAIGTFGSSLLWFPAGVAKAYPVQHIVNVLAGVMLGPIPAVIIAFVTGLLRNLMGTGSLLAFPGGMIGAFLAGYLFRKVKRTWGAPVGEVIGSGLIAPLFAVPYAKIVMGTTVGAFFFLPPFIVSSFSGALIGLILVHRLKKTNRWNFHYEK